ncbi:hypothetical protein NDU88_002036 [Pleurodeles waltl]|uniref:Uncharacterized protein n=1 Tax=Pleurodeles waltl TaxID=8319 RepID=A0AAV7VBQ9_PLEWA|nr:hypothetical protein NDU88_002036 [Pleurodeles waltl]
MGVTVKRGLPLLMEGYQRLETVLHPNRGEFCETLGRPEKVARKQNGDRVLRSAHGRPENERKPLSKRSNRSPKPSPKKCNREPVLHPIRGEFCETLGRPEKVARKQNGDRVLRSAHGRPENERKPLSKRSNRSPKPSPKKCNREPGE